MHKMSADKRGIVAAVGCCTAIFWPGAFVFGFPGVMGRYWQMMFHVGKGPIGNILFFILAPVGVFMFFVGRWQERFGTRKMITVGAIICGLSIIQLTFASSITMLYLWGFLMGFGSCFIYIPALTTVQRWYPGRRGLLSGIVNMVFGGAGAVMSPIFAHMLGSMGYVSMNIVLAIIALAVGITAAQFTETPEKLGLLGVDPEAGERAYARLRNSLTVGETIRTRSFWFLWLTWALQGAAGIAMVTLSTAFGLSRGFDMESAVIILTVFNIMNGVSRITMGYFSDIVGRNSIMSVTFFAAGCAYFVLPHITGLAASTVLAAIIGFAFGTLFAVSAPLAADCFGLDHFGAILGLVFTAYGFVSGVIGPSLSGYILDASEGNFLIVFTYLGMFCVLSGFLIRSVLPPQVK
jgi:OFA family oxalate/formate antiporter-like MFS transporter